MNRKVYCVLLLLTLSNALANDIDVYSQYSSVTAPQSPLKTVWGAYESQNFSGAFTYNHPIEVAPGIRGLTPQIPITYNSQSVQGRPNWLGAGWQLSIPYIQRDIEYSRKDISDDTFDLNFYNGNHDLVFAAGQNRYHTKIETDVKIIKSNGGANSKGEYWLLYTKDGTEYRFGYSHNSEHIVGSTDTSVNFVWRWGLDRIRDVHGNEINFTYLENPFPGDKGAIYIDEITYGTNTIKFEWETSTRPDYYVYVEEGSEIRLARRLKSISGLYSNSTLTDAIVWKHEFSYIANEIGTRSLLSEITRYGKLGTNSLPPTKFEYESLNKEFLEPISWNIPGSQHIRDINSELDTDADVLDMNNDGLPDFVDVDKDDGEWDIYLNTGTGFANSKYILAGLERYIRFVNEPQDPDDEADTAGAVMDFNRDGYPDQIKVDRDAEIQVFRSNGGTSWQSVADIQLPLGGRYVRELRSTDDDEGPDVKQEFADMNGDGYPDLIMGDDGQDHFDIWFYDGSSFGSNQEWFVPWGNPWIWNFKDDDGNPTEKGRYDINGDGLPDLIDANNAVWKVWINTGSGFVSIGNWNAKEHINAVQDDGDVEREFIDMNGDGLPDMVEGGTSNWDVWLNTGRGFTGKTEWDVPRGFHTNLPDDLVREVEDDDGDVTRDIMDLNGDNLPDIIRERGSPADWLVYRNNAAKADLLKTITTPYGGTITASYKSSRENQGYHLGLPFNVWVIDTITENNGLSGDHKVITTKTYDFKGGSYSYSDREMRGFSLVRETYSDDDYTEYTFLQGSDQKGKRQFETTYESSGTILRQHENIWDHIVGYSTWWEVRLSAERETLYDGTNSSAVIENDFTYDVYGNVESQILGKGLPYAITRTNEYTYNTGDWIVNTPKSSLLTGAGGTPISQRYYYDGSLTHGTPPTKGNLTRSEIYDGRLGWIPETSTYYANGNLASIIDGRNQTTSYTYTLPNLAHVSTTTNSLGHIRTTNWNAMGQLVFDQSAGGLEITIDYDDFYRKNKEFRSPPNGIGFELVTQTDYDIDGVAPERVITYKPNDLNDLSAGRVLVYDYIDGIGRLVQSTISDHSTMDYFYDSRGRLLKQGNPRDDTSNYSSPSLSSLGISYYYDALNRPTQIINQAGKNKLRNYKAWTIDATDENGNLDRLEFDGLKRLIRLDEVSSDGSRSTSYNYDHQDNLLSIIDVDNNVWNYEYDSRSNMITMTDPDRGNHDYQYDHNSNLVLHTDARDIISQYVFDPINRIKKEIYPNDKDVIYIYDQQYLGTLSEVTHDLGSTSYSYDQRLRKTGETMKIDGLSWDSSWTYNAQDRVSTETRPDGELITYTHNSVNNEIESISGIVSNVTYATNGMLSRYDLDNGLRVTRSYQPDLLRLSGIGAAGVGSINLTYDDVGNVKTLTDTGLNQTGTFNYDDLDQIKTASYINRPESYSYSYDVLGNMTQKSSSSQNHTFNIVPGTHQISSVTGLPQLFSVILNGGKPTTGRRSVSLEIFASSSPAEYRVTENGSQGAWLPFSIAVTYQLSTGFAQKNLLIEVRNSYGEALDGVTKSVEYILDTDHDGIHNDTDIDDDGDGMPDTYEEDNNLDSLDSGDAQEDADGDGVSNYQEYLDGTDPNDPSDFKKQVIMAPIIYLLMEDVEPTPFEFNGIDLVVSAFSVQNHGNNTVTYTYKIKNMGVQPALLDGVYVDISAHDGAYQEPAGTQLVSLDIGETLYSGDEKELSFTTSIDLSVFESLQINVDSSDVLEEGNELNNITSITL